MRHQFLPEAQAELEAATEWYEKQSEGVGIRFLQSVHTAIDRICGGADTFAFFDPPFRYCPVKDFPYIVIYTVDEFVEVVAVMHTRRRPGYWQGRTSQDNATKGDRS